MGNEEQRERRAKLRELVDWWADPNPAKGELNVLSKILQCRVFLPKEHTPKEHTDQHTDLVEELLTWLELVPEPQAAEAARRLMGTDHEVMFSILWNLDLLEESGATIPGVGPGVGPKGARRFILGDIATNGLGDWFGLMARGFEGAAEGCSTTETPQKVAQ